MAGFSDYKCAIIQTTKVFFYNVVCLSWFMVGIVSSERQPGQVTVCLLSQRHNQLFTLTAAANANLE